MKQTAYLINTARGGVVDQVALREALEAGEIAGAGLDVTTPEPLPADDPPLLRAPNLLVVPHVGSATFRTRSRMADMAVDNLLAALAGGEMPHRGVVTPVAAVDIGSNSTRLLIADGRRALRARVDRHAARARASTATGRLGEAPPSSACSTCCERLPRRQIEAHGCAARRRGDDLRRARRRQRRGVRRARERRRSASRPGSSAATTRRG